MSNATGEDPGADPDTRVGRYRLVRPLGRGGAGLVYLGVDEELKREVAVKILRLAPEMDPGSAGRFEREARAVATVQDHDPRIVPIYDIGRAEGVVYLVFRYVPGRTLADLTHEPSEDPLRLATLVAEAAEAVGIAHRLGVVHRDLKPSNILVDEAGKVWVSDFGIAALAGEAGFPAAGPRMGTPGYMAPEAFEERFREVGPSLDVYSLGVMLYEALAGRHPFDGEDSGIAALVRRVLLEEPADPRVHRPTTPPELAALALRSIAKDARRRPKDGGEFAAELRRALLELRSPGAAWRRARGRRLVAAAAVLATIAFASYLALLPRPGGEEEPAGRLIEALPPIPLPVEIGASILPRGAAVSPDGSRLAVAYLSGSVAIFRSSGSIPELERVLSIEGANRDGHRHAFHAAFNPRGDVLAVAATGGGVELFDPGTGERLGVLVEAASERANLVRFHPERPWLVAAGWDAARIWDYERQVLVARLEHGGHEVEALAVSPDGSTILTAGQEDRVRAWDWSGRLLDEWSPEATGPRRLTLLPLAFGPDGREFAILASRAEAPRLHLHEVSSPGAIATLELPWFSRAMDWEPGGERLAVGLDDGRIQILCVSASGFELEAETGKDGIAFMSLLWAAGGGESVIYGCRSDGSVSRWRVR